MLHVLTSVSESTQSGETVWLEHFAFELCSITLSTRSLAWMVTFSIKYGQPAQLDHTICAWFTRVEKLVQHCFFDSTGEESLPPHVSDSCVDVRFPCSFWPWVGNLLSNEQLVGTLAGSDQ